jgi:MscS family membrane protein
VGAYSLDVEVTVYVTTSDYDEFVELQQELLLKILQAVESSGTALAVPLQEASNRCTGGAEPKRAIRLVRVTRPGYSYCLALPDLTAALEIR